MTNMRIGICQMPVVREKSTNLETARMMIEEAAAAGCKLAILPEMFNCPYKAELLAEYAEPSVGGESAAMLSKAAQAAGITVVGGSVSERDEEGRIYNTSFIYGPDGKLLGRHRKIHLFDVEIKGGTVFKESDILSPGEGITLFPVEGVTAACAICYDIRFPELARKMTLAGAQLLIYPAVFSTSTGPVHWELLLRSRAVDNQVFVIGAGIGNAPGRSNAYGHSMAVDPWGTVLAKAGTDPQLLIADLDFDKISSVREQLPLLQHRRPALY